MPRKPDRDSSVFINCPFDPSFSDTFDAIVFAVLCCQLTPRSALEAAPLATTRIDQIFSGMVRARFSIHDLSRFTGEGSDNLARFNMPLELGMAMAISRMPQGDEPPHKWIALTPPGYQYQQFISDLAGFDPPRYDRTPDGALAAVLRSLPVRSHRVSPEQALPKLTELRRARERLAEQWRGEVPWEEFVLAAERIARGLQAQVRPPRTRSNP